MAAITHFLFEPYRYGYQQRALVEVLLLGGLGAVVGVHVLLRRLAFLTEALQHTVFPGIAIAFAADQSLLLGAAVAAAATVVVLVPVARRGGVGDDTALAVVVAAFFAIGVVVVSRRRGYTADLNALLFGRILSVSWLQVLETVVVGAVVVVVLVALHKELVLRAFDATQAEALGYRTAVLDLLLDAAVAATVVVAVRAVGTALVMAFVVTPAAAARLVTSSVPSAMLLAALLAGVLGWLGLSLSYDASVHHDVRLAAGATVVVVMTAGFLVVAMVHGIAGRLGRRGAAVR